MPADANSYERMLARDVDGDGDTCWACAGRGLSSSGGGGTVSCPVCNGTGTVPDDAMDEADSLYERAGDR